MSSALLPRAVTPTMLVALRLGDRFHFGLLMTTSPVATPLSSRLAAVPLSRVWLPPP